LITQGGINPGALGCEEEQSHLKASYTEVGSRTLVEPKYTSTHARYLKQVGYVSTNFMSLIDSICLEEEQ
jgi:hypothetical protein